MDPSPTPDGIGGRGIGIGRALVAGVAVVATMVAALTDPRAVLVAALLVALLLGLLVAVVVRGTWRTLTRPLSSLSVGDALVGVALLRWWDRRRRRTPRPWPVGPSARLPERWPS